MMSGSISGLQNLIKEKYSETDVLLIHCFAHRLNSVLQKSTECKI